MVVAIAIIVIAKIETGLFLLLTLIMTTTPTTQHITKKRGIQVADRLPFGRLSAAAAVRLPGGPGP